MEEVKVVRTNLGETRWIGAAAAAAVVVGLTVSGCAAGSTTADPPKVVPAVAAAAGDAGTQPEDVLPANAIAFAKVNLNPSVMQKVALFRLASKFPKLKVTEKAPIKESMSSLFTEPTSKFGPGLDFKKDVEPWLGSQIGVGVFPDLNGDKEPEVGAAIAVTDEKAAKVALDKAIAHMNRAALLAKKTALVGEEVAGKAGKPAPVKPTATGGYAFTNGYVILSDTTAHATALAKAGKAGSLAKSRYAGDVNKLGPDQIGVMWADMAAVYKAVPADQMAALGSLKEAMKGVGDPTKASGRIVMGLRADASFLEVTGKVIDFKGVAPVKARTGTALISTFPTEAWGAVTMTGLGKQVGALYTAFTAKGDTLGMKSGLAQVGISSAKQIEMLLGAETGVMVSGTDLETSQMEFAVRTRGSDADAALGIVRSALGAFPSGGMLQAAKVTGPDGIVVGYGPGLTAAISNRSGSKLGGTEAFKQVMPDADKAHFAAYVDLAKVLSMSKIKSQDAAALKPLKALGMTATDGSSFRLRVSVK